jgi:predicted phosphoadenosine phosphosulfate sulfurtransferase
MSRLKRGMGISVYEAAQQRISYAFDNFEKVYVSFSGGKDSSVMFHMVLMEAKKRDKVVGVFIVDMEAQYHATIEHIEEMIDMYEDHIDLHWYCLPIALRNAVTNFKPQWLTWDQDAKDLWIRPAPKRGATDPKRYPFYQPGLEFEELIILWGLWYADGKSCGGFIGIRADESLNRFRTIAVYDKETHGGKRYTTKIDDGLYNVYPLYDWRTEDIWRFHAKHPDLPHNRIYDLMQKAGVPLSQQRLCQPYGDDQRRGLYLYHILEPQTWFRLINRVNGVNSGALYVQEAGNVMGYGKIAKPDGHTWKSFCHLLLSTLPKPTRDHYVDRFQRFIKGWRGRGYSEIPDEAPKVLEDAQWAPSYRRMVKVLLRNDWWCKGLGMQQPKSEAYQKYLQIKKELNAEKKASDKKQE